MSSPFKFSGDYMRNEGDGIVVLPPGEQVPEMVFYTPFSAAGKNATHPLCNVSELQAYTRGKGVKVAILDTGADMSHSSYRDRIRTTKDFTGSYGGASDGHGHGTHCAGIAVGGSGGTAPEGVASEADLIVGKVLTNAGAGLTSWIADGVVWATDQGADIISMSLGGGGPDRNLHDAIMYATQNGVIIVAAAGNSGPGQNTIDYPGGFPEVWCCGATDNTGMIASFSSRGEAIDFTTPGVSVLSAFPGDRTAVMSGTSMATPYLAGLLALLKSMDKERKYLTNDAAASISALSKWSRDAGPKGWDSAYGWGMPQWVALFKELAGTPVPPPPPPPTTPGDLVLSYSNLRKEGKTRVVLLLDS